MKKIFCFRNWIAGLIVVLLSSCSGVEQIRTQQLPTITPVAKLKTNTPVPQTPPPDSPYLHYTPTTWSSVHVEFDYPREWTFSAREMQGGVIDISLGDPRFRDLPTPIVKPEYLRRTPNDFGLITISIFPLEIGQTSESELESIKRNYSQISWMKVLDDFVITLDGYDASVLEYRMNDLENYTSMMFARRIFFVVNKQFYEIYFEVAEKDRGGEFEKGYEYFFKSIKIIP